MDNNTNNKKILFWCVLSLIDQRQKKKNRLILKIIGSNLPCRHLRNKNMKLLKVINTGKNGTKKYLGKNIQAILFSMPCSFWVCKVTNKEG